MKTVSIIIPAMNEESGIGPTIDELPLGRLRERGYVTEVLVVDGNSKDFTVPIAESKGARIVLEPRKGYGRAYKTGFKASRGDYLATLDGDGSYPAGEIPRLLDYLIDNDLDFVTTSRLSNLQPGAMSFPHRLGNELLSLICRTLLHVKIRDSQSGMWVFRRDLLERVGVSSDGMSFSQEFKIRSFQSAACIELPISYRMRKGEPKLSALSDGYSNLRGLLSLRRNRIVLPLKVPPSNVPEILSQMSTSPGHLSEAEQ